MGHGTLRARIQQWKMIHNDEIPEPGNVQLVRLLAFDSVPKLASD